MNRSVQYVNVTIDLNLRVDQVAAIRETHQAEKFECVPGALTVYA